MTIRQNINSADQVKRHLAVAERRKSTALEIHVLMCEDMVHCRDHGDTSLLKHLYNALGGADKKNSTFSDTNMVGFKAWLVEMSGDQIVLEGTTWKMKRGWNATKFKTDQEMESTTFWQLEPQKEPKALSWEMILNSIKSYRDKKIDNAVSEGTFRGDPDAIKTILENVIELAEVKAARLTKQQLGVMEKKADAILKAADAKGETRTAVSEAKNLGRQAEGLPMGQEGPIADEPVVDEAAAA